MELAKVLEMLSGFPVIVRRIVYLVAGVVASVVLPILFYVAGKDMEKWNINGRSPHTTWQEARDYTWDWSGIGLKVGLTIGLIALVASLLHFFLAKEDKRSPWH